MADKHLEELSITTGLNMTDVLYLVRLPGTDPNDYQVTWQSVMNQIEVDLVFPHPFSYHTDALPGAPGNTGDVWRFNASNLKWVQQKLSYLDLVDVPLTFPPDAHDLDFHSDVDLTTVPPVGGDALVYDGADWIPGPSSTIPDGLWQLQELGQGTHREEVTHGISVVGGTEIRYTIDNELDPGSEVTFYMRDGVLYELDTPEYVVLPPGTDANPILYWLYMEIVGSTPTLKYTTDILTAFGANATLLGEVELQSIATTDTDGALVFRSMTNHIETHLPHLDSMLRLNVGPFIFSGLDYSNTLTTTTQLDIDTTTGIVWGLHFHEYDTRNTALGDNIWLGFEDWAQISNITLVTVPEDSEGVSLQNKWFSLVFGLSFATDGNHRLTMNLPSGSYNAEDDAENDVFNYTNYESPFTLANANILLYRLTMKFANNGVITLGEVVDLRTGAVGAGAGGGGTSAVLVAELDLDPRFAAVELQFNNGSVTDAGSGIAQIDVAAHTAEEMTNFSSGASEQQVPKYSSGISTWVPGWVDWTEISNVPLTFPPDGGPYVPVAGGTFTGGVNFVGSTQTVFNQALATSITILNPTGNAGMIWQSAALAAAQVQVQMTSGGIFRIRQLLDGASYSNRMQFLLSGAVTLNAGNWYVPSGAAFFQQTAADGVVTLGPNINDPNTGIGWHSADRMQLIVGGVTTEDIWSTIHRMRVPFRHAAVDGDVKVISSGTTAAIDTDLYNFWELTATGNITISNPTTDRIGYVGVIAVTASGAARTVTMGTKYYDTTGSAFNFVVASGDTALLTFTSVATGVYMCNLTNGYTLP